MRDRWGDWVRAQAVLAHLSEPALPFGFVAIPRPRGRRDATRVAELERPL